ncbi:MAG: PTS sugar transporter subunit IIA [Planctomycetes bacterium]|nr:PTS sugar transporter subunit IIA [Planctomycetota bacterium]
MRMSDFVVREAITADLAASQKDAVIREMVDKLRTAGFFKGNEAEDVVKAILKRELLSSTGIGDGVAIPHAKHGSVDRLVGAVALAPQGVPFDSVDNDPVFVLVMLISPQERPSEHLRALEGVSRCLKDKKFVQSLREAKSPDQIWDLICNHERGA